MNRPDGEKTARGPADPPRPPYGGLCSECRHARTIRSDKGSVFVLCGKAKDDPRFPRYPPQPVARCTGFERY
ncbi:MAG TPA: hypothetical protein VK843_17580 [Planctomycetota bacterium]|nr:hypothetical protein [Planctomycetota bacterium]